MIVGVIFGGKSCEHDISVVTGVMTANAARINHEVIPIYIDGKGEWFFGKEFFDTSTFTPFNFNKAKKKKVHLRPASNILYAENGRKIAALDAIIICNHGLNGEDGTLSGLLELSGIPYAGSGVLASSIGMDKLIQKKLYSSAGLNVTPFIGIEKADMDDKLFDLVSAIESNLKFPLMVKPSRLGSSIGISRANDFKELFERLSEAFEWDNRVVIEEALTDFIEVNCAVLGQGNKLIVSVIEQPLSEGFLSYSDKYEGGGKGDTGRYLPAHISKELAETVRETAKKVFRLIGCAGVARVDFLIKDDVVYVNEINTVPGSMSSYLFSFDKMEFCAVIDKLLEIAFCVHEDKNRLKYTYNSDVLRINLRK